MHTNETTTKLNVLFCMWKVMWKWWKNNFHLRKKKSLTMTVFGESSFFIWCDTPNISVNTHCIPKYKNHSLKGKIVDFDEHKKENIKKIIGTRGKSNLLSFFTTLMWKIYFAFLPSSATYPEPDTQTLLVLLTSFSSTLSCLRLKSLCRPKSCQLKRRSNTALSGNASWQPQWVFNEN